MIALMLHKIFKLIPSHVRVPTATSVFVFGHTDSMPFARLFSQSTSIINRLYVFIVSYLPFNFDAQRFVLATQAAVRTLYMPVSSSGRETEFQVEQGGAITLLSLRRLWDIASASPSFPSTSSSLICIRENVSPVSNIA